MPPTLPMGGQNKFGDVLSIDEQVPLSGAAQLTLRWATDELESG